MPLHHMQQSSIQGLSVLHIGWSAPLRVSSGCEGPSLPQLLSCHGLSLLSPPIVWLPWWGGREGEAILTDLWPPTMSSAWLQLIVVLVHTFGLMMTESFETLAKIVPITYSSFIQESTEKPLKQDYFVPLSIHPKGIVSFCLLLFCLFAYSITTFTDTAPQWGWSLGTVLLPSALGG